MTHRCYLWTFCTTRLNPVKAVVYHFADNRSSQYVREFLGLKSKGAWSSTLITYDYVGYQACFDLGVTEGGCMRRADFFTIKNSISPSHSRPSITPGVSTHRAVQICGATSVCGITQSRRFDRPRSQGSVVS